MKKRLLLLSSMAILIFTGCQDTQTSDSGTWTPRKNVNFYVASSPGGGADMYSRSIADVLSTDGLVEKNIIISNETDGGGEVIRNKVAHSNDDHTILAFVSGAVTNMHKNPDIKITMDNFTPIAILAADKHLFFAEDNSKYQTIEEIIDALKAGENIVMSGSKSDDMTIYDKFIQEIGVTNEQLTYIPYDSSSEAIVSLLGEHVDFCISKPAAAMEYVKSGDLVPLLALSTARFGEPLADVPILSELGYNDIEMPTWRGIVGPGNMKPEVLAFWDNAFEQASQSPAWIDYMEKNLLVPMYMNAVDAKSYISEYEQNVIDSLALKE